MRDHLICNTKGGHVGIESVKRVETSSPKLLFFFGPHLVDYFNQMLKRTLEYTYRPLKSTKASYVIYIGQARTDIRIKSKRFLNARMLYI